MTPSEATIVHPICVAQQSTEHVIWKYGRKMELMLGVVIDNDISKL